MGRVLTVIVISQFFCTSLWFAGNAVMPDIVRSLGIHSDFLAHLTSAVQLGFITGTLTFAILNVADRFSPSWVFFSSSLAAAICNLGIVMDDGNANSLLLFRFVTGFFLAGIYPVGMKIASDHYKEGLGKSLGFLVGALVLGTAIPHLIKSMTLHLPWKNVVFATSALSVLGGLIMVWLVPDGPYRRPALKIQLSAFIKGFRNNRFRAASFGYFGHMWELYTFWAFVPVMLATYQSYYPAVTMNIPLLAFCIIGSGGFACVISGFLSQVFAAKKIAAIALFLSGTCCILSPLFLSNSSVIVFIIFLFCWGLAVIADSPLFSTLVAQNAPEESRGTSLTIVNCIGFTITIISIQLLNFLLKHNDPRYVYMILAIGPALGLFALLKRDRAR